MTKKSQKNHEMVPQSKSHKSYVFQDRRVLGYELDTDLQPHYDFLEYIYLLSTGSFPTQNQKMGLDLLLRNITLCKANATPLHAARASRCAGGTTQATILVAVLAENDDPVFDPELGRALAAIGFKASSIGEAFSEIGIRPAFAETLNLLLSSFGTLSEAFRGDGTLTEFPTSLPQFEYESD